MRVHEQSGGKNYHYGIQAGPTVSEKCPECESTLHVSVWTADFSYIFEKVSAEK